MPETFVPSPLPNRILNIDLPVVDVIPDLLKQLQRRDEVVLEAPPGAGKTTLLPLMMLDQPWLGDKKILLLEPRRLAARGAAERMAELLGEAVGQTVGYRVRMESRIGPSTRIEVITEGILTRMLIDDPSLDSVGMVIFDEFHERSLDADLGLALSLQSRELFSDMRDAPLKLLIMSATLDGDAVARLLVDTQGCPAPVIRSQGKMYPVDIRYAAAFQYGERIVDRVIATVKLALAEQTGSLLVFLPGKAEINQVAQGLRPLLATYDDLLIMPLYGDLSLAEQRRCIAPVGEGKRKVVLATSIAETSLTIDGVSVVIDSGLSRLGKFDPTTGMTRLQTQRVSVAASTQRCGRAGRLEPGVCYRLWSKDQQQGLQAFTPPDILQADLAPLVLQLLKWGVADPAELRWLDLPPQAMVQQALDLLITLNAVEATQENNPQPHQEISAAQAVTHYQLTPQGQLLANFPLHPRLGYMLLAGQSYGLGQQACELAALLSERDLSGMDHADLHYRLELLRGERQADRQQQGPLKRLRELSQQFARLLTKTPVNHAVVNPEAERWLGYLVACAYPDRIAKRRQDKNLGRQTQFQLSNGRTASFVGVDPLQDKTWLVVAQLGGNKQHREERSEERIFVAAALDPELFNTLLKPHVITRDLVQWDYQSEKLIAEQQRCIGALVLEKKALAKLDNDLKAQALKSVVQKKGLGIFNWSEALQQWRCRVELLRQLAMQNPEIDNPWPDVTDAGLLATLDQWLVPYLDGVSQLVHFAGLDIQRQLDSLLPWTLRQQLDQLAPERVLVPSGSQIKIDYRSSPPVLAVKLQEMFGCQTTPTLANGRVAVVVHLLSPARRPLQVTQDLSGFWQTSYHDVKKEMKGRYPKHHWPDNPLEAVASSRTTKPKI